MRPNRPGIIKLITFTLLIGAYFFISTKDLYIDGINPDGINWHTRTQAFTAALPKGAYGDTFQAYHPGTTLMWIAGPLLNAFKFGDSNNNKTGDAKAAFLDMDYQAKLSVVIFCTILFALILIPLSQLVSFKYSILYAVFFSFEPFAIGMRRLYHLDFLMTTLLFLSFLLLIYYHYKSPRWALIIFAGLLYALALLTKCTAIVFLPALPIIFLLGNSGLFKKLA